MSRALRIWIHAVAPREGVWQHNMVAGYRFPRRHAEIRLGVLNVTDEAYRLNPLNLHGPLARSRRLTVGVRLSFREAVGRGVLARPARRFPPPRRR